MKKIFALLVLMASFQIMATGAVSTGNTAQQKQEVKKFSTLEEAAKSYAGVLQEVANYGSRRMLKTINADVDKYVEEKKDAKLKKLWEDTNTMLLEQFEVSVYKVEEGKTGLGDVVFLIKGYDEEALNKYLNSNLDKYAKINREKGEVDINIEKYIELQHNYLKGTKKVNIATSTVNFSKINNEWKVIEKNKK